MTLIALHILQNHAPSNLNRDDNGDPKDCLFGGFRRARISSQALKRRIRWSDVFRDYFAETPELLAERTQLLPEMVRERITDLDLAPEAKTALVQAASRLGKGERPAAEASDDSTEGGKKARRGKKNDSEESAEQRVKTAQLVFLTPREVDQLAERMVEVLKQQGLDALNGLSGDKLVAALGSYEPHAVDIAMFGRMTTSSPLKNVEAAVQVAHALSTHAVEQEFDFYTAVDDISGETGAGFIGETTFNSATYYKYINIHWEGLVENLQSDKAVAQKAVRALIHAALLAIPSGKQNSFAAHNPPDLALIEVRPASVALSYANAFAQPIRATTQQSLVEASASKLQDYISRLNAIYNLPAQRAFISMVPFELAEAQHCSTLDELLSWLPLEV